MTPMAHRQCPWCAWSYVSRDAFTAAVALIKHAQAEHDKDSTDLIVETQKTRIVSIKVKQAGT
jgi:hypothetical protein